MLSVIVGTLYERVSIAPFKVSFPRCSLNYTLDLATILTVSKSAYANAAEIAFSVWLQYLRFPCQLNGFDSRPRSAHAYSQGDRNSDVTITLSISIVCEIIPAVKRLTSR